jgi:hypothetical protein
VLLRFSIFTLRSETDTNVLEISVPLGNCLPRLPQWLHIPYIRIVPPVDTTYARDGSGPTFDRIRQGDMITDKFGQPSSFGTLGTILVDRVGTQDTYYGITAGHVLSGGSSFLITQRNTNKAIGATSATNRNPDKSDNISAEVGILKLGDDCLDSVYTIMHRIDVNHFREMDLSSSIEPDFLDVVTRAYSIAEAKKRSNIYVFKDGASSGLTMGRLGDLRWEFPARSRQAGTENQDTESNDGDSLMSSDSDENLLQEYQNLIKPKMHRWVGLVDWTAELSTSRPAGQQPKAGWLGVL